MLSYHVTYPSQTACRVVRNVDFGKTPPFGMDAFVFNSRPYPLTLVQKIRIYFYADFVSESLINKLRFK